MGCAPSRSLPAESEEGEAEERSRAIDRQLRAEGKVQARLVSILLLGASVSAARDVARACDMACALRSRFPLLPC